MRRGVVVSGGRVMRGGGRVRRGCVVGGALVARVGELDRAWSIRGSCTVLIVTAVVAIMVLEVAGGVVIVILMVFDVDLPIGRQVERSCDRNKPWL